MYKILLILMVDWHAHFAHARANISFYPDISICRKEETLVMSSCQLL